MEFPIYKGWMGESNTKNDVYIQGVREFVKYARRCLQFDDFPCPCTRCGNGKRLHFEEVELHLVKWGITREYKKWNLHGERDTLFVPEHIQTSELMQVEDDLSTHPRLNDLIDDAFRVHILQDNHPMNCEVDQEHQGCSSHVDAEVNQDKEAEKIVEIRSGQDECTQNDIDLDALTQVKGKDRKGRTRGVGSTSKTNLKAMRPIVLEHQEMKNAINQNDQKLSRMEEMFTEKMDMILSSINLLSSRSPQQYSFPYAPTSQNIQPQVSSPFSNQSAPTHAPAYMGYYHIKDVSTNSKNIAMATIKEVTPGIIVHTRAMKSPEVKLYVLEVYPGMEDEPVYLSQQGCNTTIGEFVKSFVVWPIYMLEKIM